MGKGARSHNSNTDENNKTPVRVAVTVAHLHEEDLPPRDQADELWEQLSGRFEQPEANAIFLGPDPSGRIPESVFLQGIKGTNLMCSFHVIFRDTTKRYEVQAGGMVPNNYTARHGEEIRPISDVKLFRTVLMMSEGINWKADLAIPTTKESDERSN